VGIGCEYMIVVLFFVSLLLAVLAERRSKLRFFSPTFLSAGMFAVYSFIYIITFYNMKSDISLNTVLVITAALLATAFGEFIANYYKSINRENRNYKSSVLNSNIHIKISKIKVYIYSAVMLFFFVYNFRTLRSVTLEYSEMESFDGILDMMVYARQALLQRGYAIHGVLINQIIYLHEVVILIFIYAFMNNLLVCKKKDWYMLLPLIPDFLYRFETTSRSSFIFLIFGVVAIYLKIKMDHILLRFSWKIILAVSVAFVVLYIYGNIRNANNWGIVSYLQSYTCGSIYAFDHLLKRGIENSPYFGFYMFKNIYNTLNIQHDVLPSQLMFVNFSNTRGLTNIYTSLMYPVSDFGIVGMIIIRIFESILGYLIIAKFRIGRNNKASSYLSIYFAVAMIFCFLYSPINDLFPDYLWNPGIMIRYFVYGFVFLKLYLKPCIGELMATVKKKEDRYSFNLGIARERSKV